LHQQLNQQQMTKKTLILMLCFMSVLAYGQNETADFESRTSKTEGSERREGTLLPLFEKGITERKDKALSILVNNETLAWVWENEPAEFTVQIPMPEGGVQKLDFVKARILTPEFAVSTSDGRKLYGKEYEGIHYQIRQTKSSKVGGLSFREGGVMGVFSTDRGNYNIGETIPGKGDYVIVNDADMDRPKWSCGTENIVSEIQESIKAPQNDKSVTTICKTVRLYLEADYNLYVRSGNSISTSSTFITGLFNIVSQLYLNEGINLKLNAVYQWTTVDPYATFTTEAEILTTFATNRPPASLNGDIGQLISTRSSSLGGLGYISVFCGQYSRHSFASIYYTYGLLPSYSWSVYVTTHEIGHNFGSKHTQWCGWTLPGGTTGRIDSCFKGEGTCGTTTKARTGTIMSYCHITSGGVNFNLGFGPLPGKAIRDGLNAATCIATSGCMAKATLKTDSATNYNNSYLVTVTIPVNHGATSWSVLEGSTVIQSGSLANQNAVTQSITLSGKLNGSYSYTARLMSGSTSTISSILVVTVAVPAVSTGSGICTANGLQTWTASGQYNFKFGLSQTCTTYHVQVCRYNYSNPLVPPPVGATSVACGVRNGMTAYTPTTAERAAGWIERVQSPQPSAATTPGFGSWWYSVDVTCAGSNCTTTNRTRTYFFVPGI